MKGRWGQILPDLSPIIPLDLPLQWEDIEPGVINSGHLSGQTPCPKGFDGHISAPAAESITMKAKKKKRSKAASVRMWKTRRKKYGPSGQRPISPRFKAYM